MRAPAKAELKWQIEQLEAELVERRKVGARMSDVCFTFGEPRTQRKRDDVQELYKRWDAIKRVEVAR